VVTKKESGTRYIGDARGHEVKRRKSGPEASSRAQVSVAERE
jgi:hypothetical protein